MHCSIYKSRKYKTDAIKIYGAADYLEDPMEPETVAELLDKYLEAGVKPSPQKAKASAAAVPDIPMPEMPKTVSTKKKAAAFDVDKALEDTFSGVSMGYQKKAKVKEAEESKPQEAPPAPEPPEERAEAASPEPIEEPQDKPAEGVGGAPPPAAPPKNIEDDTQAPVSSEELFGDVLHEVEGEEAAPAEAPPEPEIEEPPAPEPAPEPDEKEPEAEAQPEPEEEKPKTAPPQEMQPKKAPKKQADIGKDLLEASKEDTGVRKAKKAKAAGLDLDKELEDTLSGVGKKKKRKMPKAAPPPPPPPKEEKPAEEPAPAPVEEKAAEAPKPAEKPPAEKKKPAAVKPPPPEPKKVKAEEPPPEPKVERAAEILPSEEGITYGKYLLVDKIAVGGMAELFKAKQKGPEDFQRIVAIKRILPHLAANQEFVTMFIDEAKLAAQLNHPNIGHIYDLGKIDDTYFIAMEYIEGSDLRAILRELTDRKIHLPLTIAVFIAQALCSALHYAHSAKDADRRSMDLVHRDISPQNILISTSGEVKLVDFGIAKAATKASHTQSGALKGKLLYMSPEQAWGKKIDSRTDIFSLGTVLYEMLTGKKLFSGDSEMSILEKVRTATVTSPKEAREDLPDSLERIVMKALKKDPSQRYQDCRGMQQALEQFCYKEWNSLPTSPEAALYLHDIFPDIYTKEALKELQEEADTAPETVKMKAKPELAAEKPAPKEAPKPKKEPAKPKKKAKEAKKQAPKPPPPPPPALEEKKEKTSPMFQGITSDEGAGKKKGMIFGAIGIVVVIIAIIIGVVFFGGKGEEAPPTPPPQDTAQEIPDAAEEVTEEPVEEVIEETPEPIDEGATEEEQIQAARGRAQRAMNQFNDAVAQAEQAEAAQYATEAFNVLKDRQQNLTALFAGAQTQADYQSIRTSSRQGVQRANQIKTDAETAKVAADAETQRLADEAEQARIQAEEERRRQEEAAAAAEAQAAEEVLKPGDFVEAWALDVKPKPSKAIQVSYTTLARRNRLEGTVYYEVSVDERGTVTDVKIVKGFDNDFGMHDAIIQAARGTKFSPGIKGGIPVKTKMTYPINFRMR